MPPHLAHGGCPAGTVRRCHVPALSYQPLMSNCHPLPPTSSHRQAAWWPHGGSPGPGSRAPLSRTTVTSHTQVAAGPGAAPLPATPRPPQTCPEFPPEASWPPCHVSPPRSASARAAPAQHPRRPLELLQAAKPPQAAHPAGALAARAAPAPGPAPACIPSPHRQHQVRAPLGDGC